MYKDELLKIAEEIINSTKSIIDYDENSVINIYCDKFRFSLTRSHNYRNGSDNIRYGIYLQYKDDKFLSKGSHMWLHGVAYEINESEFNKLNAQIHSIAHKSPEELKNQLKSILREDKIDKLI
jgi:hypothetical protein